MSGYPSFKRLCCCDSSLLFGTEGRRREKETRRYKCTILISFVAAYSDLTLENCDVSGKSLSALRNYPNTRSIAHRYSGPIVQLFAYTVNLNHSLSDVLLPIFLILLKADRSGA